MAKKTISDGGGGGWTDDVLPSEAVIDTVAEENETAPHELPPLYEAIDPDALDQLFANRDGGTVTFCCCEHEITVEPNGTITISET